MFFFNNGIVSDDSMTTRALFKTAHKLYVYISLVHLQIKIWSRQWQKLECWGLAVDNQVVPTTCGASAAVDFMEEGERERGM